jgi:DNA-binding NarL/FixJ family response regulator
MSGFEFIKSIDLLPVRTKILVITAFSEDEYVRFALKLGAVGFIDKVQSPTNILKAIQVVSQGEFLLKLLFFLKLFPRIQLATTCPASVK